MNIVSSPGRWGFCHLGEEIWEGITEGAGDHEGPQRSKCGGQTRCLWRGVGIGGLG